MKNIDERRIVPASTVAIVAFSVLVLFELTFFSGAIEMKASTVKKVAPWFHGTFLRMMGEDSNGQATSVVPKAAAETPKEASGVATVAGFAPEELAVEIKVDELPASDVLIEPTVPREQAPAPIVPVTTPAEKSKPRVNDDVPVG